MISNSDNLLNNKLFLFDAKDHITFLTNKVDADYHSHNYIQITIGLEKNFTINIENEEFYTKGIILGSNISHKLKGYNEWQLYLLINPESIFGETIKRNILNETEIYILEEKNINKIIQPDINTIIETISSEGYCNFVKKIKEALNVSIFDLDHKIDNRVIEILTYIESYPLDKLTVKELSNKVFLSESRLSHLFKEEIGISLTSYILHEKLKKAFYLILKGLSITDAAMEVGFSSSSHFTRSARDKLGMAPRTIIKDSRYLKV
ncbi:helix-turn-helix transcriptional regulator [Clostridium amazonitimonense]|uniref:helix-turn-helix transcriptional regulator n=1 Tax=Clostridium amazonitimonense TaxID=1499689 RepID=UPI0005096C79|nr:AraC family transcriptional regulator [Clostridium amazonitimonense]